MRATVPFLIIAALLMAPMLRAQSQPAEAVSADALLEQVVEAYRDADRLLVDAHFTIEVTDGRWTQSNEADYRLAYRDQPQAIGLQQPMFALSVRDGKLLMTSDELPGRHLETSLPTPASFADLAAQLPVIGAIPLPALILATADDPLATLLGEPVAQTALLDPDPQGLPRVQVRGSGVEAQLTVDPRTLLLAGMRMTREVQIQPGVTAAQIQTWDFRTMQRGADLPADLLAVNVPADSEAYDSFHTLVQSLQGGPHPLTGKDAPPIEARMLDGSAFKLADMKEDVIVLEFWTTWCGPCQMALPELQNVADWAKQQNKSVGIYTVNVAEPRPLVEQHWRQMGLTMPVVMDPQGLIHQTYALPGFPATVVIADGKVAAVHSGVSPVPGQYERMMKSEIEDLIEDAGK